MQTSNIKPAFAENNVSILLTADNRYVPYVSVLLASMLTNCREANYDIIFIQKNIAPEDQSALQKQVAEYNNFSLRFVDFSEYIKDVSLRVFSYYSEAIYYRLFAPYIFKNYNKMIYLDCDLILERDLDELWEIDLGQNLMAAIRDIGLLLHRYTKGKIELTEKYFNTLQGINLNDYFNSGVLVFNFEKFRKEISVEKMLETIGSQNWNFPDQDILNVLCSGRTLHLPMAWNVLPENGGNRKVRNILRDVPPEYSEQYMQARSEPYIVHYAMREKPWFYTDTLDPPMFRYFWKYAPYSVFFDKIIEEKRKKCSMQEVAFILQNYCGFKLRNFEKPSNIHYFCGEHYIGNAASFKTIYEILEFDNGILHIEGMMQVLPDCLGDFRIEMEFNGQKIPCELFNRFVDVCIGETVISKSIGFKADISVGAQEWNQLNRIVLVAYFGGKKIRPAKIQYGRFWPVGVSLKKQYYYKEGYVFTVQRGLLQFVRCSKIGRWKKEISFWRELLQKRAHKALMARVFVWFWNRVNKKKCLLVEDNFLADDNGIAFFQYVRKEHREKKVYFVMDKGNQNYARVRKIGKVITAGSRIFKLKLLFSDVSATSIEDYRLVNPFGRNFEYFRDILHDRKYIFLQHGVTKDDMSKEHNKRIYNAAGFVVTANNEYKSLLLPQYMYRPHEVWLTGFPRYDLLYHDERNYITVMPTWRKDLKILLDNRNPQGLELFKQSLYFRFFYGLLHHERLLSAAEKYGYTLYFKIHPLFQKYTELFLREEDTAKPFNSSYREVFAQSKLTITDYSSAVFDFAYLNKPVIYTQFDRKDVFSGSHIYEKGYFDYETDGFGEVTYDLETTVDLVIEYMQNNCKLKDKYKKRIDDFFAFHDKNNSERVYNKMYPDRSKKLQK